MNLVGYRVSPNMGAWDTGNRTDALTTQSDPSGFLVAFDTTQITSKDNRCNPQPGDPCHPLASQGHAPAIAFSESGTGWWREGINTLRESQIAKPEAGVVLSIRTAQTSSNGHGFDVERSYTLDSGHGQAIAFTKRTRQDGRNLETSAEVAYALTNPASGGNPKSSRILAPCLTQNYGKQPDNSDTGEGPMLIQEGMMVRRFTPRECERLMGLPDDYSLIPYRGKPAKDAPRYRAIGNSFAVPVVRWIAQRIQQVEELITA